MRSLKFLLKQSNLKLLAIITDKKGISAKAFRKIAQENKIPCIDKIDLIKKIRKSDLINFEIDLLLSVFSPVIVDEEILNFTKYGGFNLHPGKLPEYSGLNPTTWSIYNNEKYHEVTLHKMNKLIDGGDIVYSKKIIINKDETAFSLLSKSTTEGLSLIKKFIETISLKSINKLNLKKQNLQKRKYYSKLNQIIKPLDWNNSIDEIDRIFRASFLGPFKSNLGLPTTNLNNQLIHLTNHKIKKCDHELTIGKINFISENRIKIFCKDGYLIADIVS